MNAISDVNGVTSTSPKSSLRDYWQLLKPGVMLLVVFTAAIGAMSAPTTVSMVTLLTVVFAIALGSGAGAAINMWYDADIDRIMSRTRKRPIPSGRIAEEDVLAIGLGLSVVSVAMLGLATNWAAAILLAFAIWFYACFYTMVLKRHTAQNIVIGGAAGAFPPVIGWLAVYPQLAWEPVFYFLIIFFWTPPHFWALALYRHDDYAQVKVPMLPVVSGKRTTLHNILCYTVILVAITALPVFHGSSGTVYALAALLLNGVFLYRAVRLWRHPSDKKAIGLFLYSIFYLFMLFSFVAVDKLRMLHSLKP